MEQYRPLSPVFLDNTISKEPFQLKLSNAMAKAKQLNDSYMKQLVGAMSGLDLNIDHIGSEGSYGKVAAIHNEVFDKLKDIKDFIVRSNGDPMKLQEAILSLSNLSENIRKRRETPGQDIYNLEHANMAYKKNILDPIATAQKSGYYSPAIAEDANNIANNALMAYDKTGDVNVFRNIKIPDILVEHLDSQSIQNIAKEIKPDIEKIEQNGIITKRVSYNLDKVVNAGLLHLKNMGVSDDYLYNYTYIDSDGTIKSVDSKTYNSKVSEALKNGDYYIKDADGNDILYDNNNQEVKGNKKYIFKNGKYYIRKKNKDKWVLEAVPVHKIPRFARDINLNNKLGEIVNAIRANHGESFEVTEAQATKDKRQFFYNTQLEKQKSELSRSNKQHEIREQAYANAMLEEYKKALADKDYTKAEAIRNILKGLVTGDNTSPGEVVTQISPSATLSGTSIKVKELANQLKTANAAQREQYKSQIGKEGSYIYDELTRRIPLVKDIDDKWIGSIVSSAGNIFTDHSIAKQYAKDIIEYMKSKDEYKDKSIFNVMKEFIRFLKSNKSDTGETISKIGKDKPYSVRQLTHNSFLRDYLDFWIFSNTSNPTIQNAIVEKAGKDLEEIAQNDTDIKLKRTVIPAIDVKVDDTKDVTDFLREHAAHLPVVGYSNKKLSDVLNAFSGEVGGKNNVPITDVHILQGKISEESGITYNITFAVNGTKYNIIIKNDNNDTNSNNLVTKVQMLFDKVNRGYKVDGQQYSPLPSLPVPDNKSKPTDTTAHKK